MAREIVTSENREKYIEEKMEKKSGRAKKGGEIAESNQYKYKGGQFLPTTSAEPGKWKVGNKWVRSNKELSEPGKIENSPTPFSKAIFPALREYFNQEDGKFTKVREGIRDYEGKPITEETKIRFRIGQNENKREHTYKELMDEYNKGNRWVHLDFDEPTLTKK